MSEIIRLGIANNSNQKIQEVSKAELVAGKGIVGDRHFHESNSVRNQITLILFQFLIMIIVIVVL